MRLTLKQQIILAPATVLLILSLLLGFLQYTFWDLSQKRQQAKELKSTFIALAEAELAIQRYYPLVLNSRKGVVDARTLEEMTMLYAHLEGAINRIVEIQPLPTEARQALTQSVSDLDPDIEINLDRFLNALSKLRPEMSKLSELIQQRRETLRNIHDEDIDEIVYQSALVSIVVLGSAILLGIFLSLTFARRILRRIGALSSCAAQIIKGELTPPPAPEKIRDELDELGLAINHMTNRLIHVVSAEKLLEGAEEERRRIAMDLHDQTLSDLASILRGLQQLQQLPEAEQQARELETELHRAIGGLRGVMDNLHPQTLDILGLAAAIESYVTRHLQKPELPECHLYISPAAEELSLPKLASLTFYRIALEAMHNVIKHAGGSRYEITL